MSHSVKRFCVLVTFVLTCLFLVMLVVVNGNAVTRYFFSFSFPWSEELTRYCMVWMIALGAAVLSIFDDHIMLHIPTERWPLALQKLQRVAVHVIVLAVSAVVTWTSFHFAIGMSNVQAPGLRISMIYPTLAIAVGFALVTVATLIVTYNLLAEMMGLTQIPLPPQKSVMDNSFKPAAEEDEHGAAGHGNGSAH